MSLTDNIPNKTAPIEYEISELKPNVNGRYMKTKNNYTHENRKRFQIDHNNLKQIESTKNQRKLKMLPKIQSNQ